MQYEVAGIYQTGSNPYQLPGKFGIIRISKKSGSQLTVISADGLHLGLCFLFAFFRIKPSTSLVVKSAFRKVVTCGHEDFLVAGNIIGLSFLRYYWCGVCFPGNKKIFNLEDPKFRLGQRQVSKLRRKCELLVDAVNKLKAGESSLGSFYASASLS